MARLRLALCEIRAHWQGLVNGDGEIAVKRCTYGCKNSKRVWRNRLISFNKGKLQVSGCYIVGLAESYVAVVSGKRRDQILIYVREVRQRRGSSSITGDLFWNNEQMKLDTQFKVSNIQKLV